MFVTTLKKAIFDKNGKKAMVNLVDYADRIDHYPHLNFGYNGLFLDVAPYRIKCHWQLTASDRF